MSMLRGLPARPQPCPGQALPWLCPAVLSAWKRRACRRRPVTLGPARSACCSAAEDAARGAGSGGSAAGGAGRGPCGGSLVADEELPPSQRELDNLREWVVTQQWLRQQALGGAEPPGVGNPAAAVQHLQAMQQLWDQGGRA